MGALMFLTSKFMLLTTKIMPQKGDFTQCTAYPGFIPRWYKTHYASHYPSVTMTRNEMIHIQERYLRLHFQHFQTTTCYLHIKALFSETKRLIRVQTGVPSVGNPHSVPNPGLSGWPPHLHPNAAHIALILRRSWAVNQDQHDNGPW